MKFFALYAIVYALFSCLFFNLISGLY